MKQRFYRKIVFLSLVFFSLSFVLNAQSGTKLMLDEESGLSLQSVPIYEGVEEFQAKLDQIRQEKGREPMGLVLCGGSARAFAHIGALKAMEENGVTPDFIVANSMGAIIGMFYAYGFSPDKIAEIISRISLTQYFEPVLPVHGGALSVRKYRAFVNDLLGKEHTDLSECSIPILVLTEDLYTKRQICHASGDFAKIMTAAFAMPAIMEPTKYHLQDENKTAVSLIDSGCIDIAGLSIAEGFSPNIVISTAFYDAKLDYNNIVVILNRTMSIAKERIASKEIKYYKPVLIRNNVEHFSFMAFDKSKELSEIGYQSASAVMEDILKCPHEYTDLSERRKQTDSFADAAVRHVYAGESLKQDGNYFGMKIWPVFPTVDFPDYSLYDKSGVSLFAFDDTSKFYAKLGVNFPFSFDEFCADGLIRFNPSSVFDASVFASYGFSYDHCKPSDFYGAATIKIRPPFFPYFMKSILTTAEYSAAYDFVPEDMLFTSGLLMEKADESRGYVVFKPYYFISGQDFSGLSNGAGVTLQTSVNASIFAKNLPKFSFGIADNFSCRYAFANFGDGLNAETKLYKSDFFRAEKSSDYNNYVLSNGSEIFFVNLDPGFTAAELIILKQFKLGGFYDFSYNGSFSQCAGGFGRAQFSLIGLCNVTLESGCGWNITGKKFFGYFEMKNRI